MTNSPLKWHGGKAPLATKIRSTFPPHLTYCEPYAGGLNVMLAGDGEGVSEVANDIDEELVNFWLVMRTEELFAKFRRKVEAMPFSELEWHESKWAVHFADIDAVERAVAFFVRCRQSLAGRMGHFTPISKTRTRRGMNEQVSGWLTAVDGLPEVHERLRRVLVLNRDALDVIREFDRPDCLIYCDCPYLHETRTSKAVYRHEMTREQHESFLDAVVKSRSMVAVSGYPSALYDDALRAWSRITFEVANHSSGSKSKRRMTEVLWTNYPLPESFSS